MKGHNYAGINNSVPCRTCGKLHIHHRPRKGAHLSDESKRAISEKKKGRHASPQTEFKKGLIPWNKGRTGVYSEEITQRISQTLKRKGIKPQPCWGREPWNKGKSWSLEMRRKLSEAHKGHKASEETKRKMSESHKGVHHWNWKGGLSLEPYGSGWTDRLRQSIRERDNFSCQKCGLTSSELDGKMALDVHHIDRNKSNHNPQNLITLCRACHIHVHETDSRGEGTFQK